MRRESLATLVRLRTEAVGRAQAVLAEALSVEAGRRRLAEDADARIGREAEAALDLGGEDGAVEAYARWLPQGQEEARRRHLACEEAGADVTLARTALSLARAAEHVATQALAEHDAACRARDAAREQRDLDEFGSRSGPGGGIR